MYDALCGTEVRLWCEAEKKRKSASHKNKPSKRQAIRDEVEELFAELQEKHGSKYCAA